MPASGGTLPLRSARFNDRFPCHLRRSRWRSATSAIRQLRPVGAPSCRHFRLAADAGWPPAANVGPPAKDLALEATVLLGRLATFTALALLCTPSAIPAPAPAFTPASAERPPAANVGAPATAANRHLSLALRCPPLPAHSRRGLRAYLHTSQRRKAAASAQRQRATRSRQTWRLLARLVR